MGKGNVNTQSAESVLKDMEELKRVNEEQQKKLEEQMKELENIKKMQEGSEQEVLINSLKKQIEEKDKMIADYQKINQELFLKVGVAVDEKPLKSESELEEERQQEEVEEIEKKIKEQNDAYVEAHTKK